MNFRDDTARLFTEKSMKGTIMNMRFKKMILVRGVIKVINLGEIKLTVLVSLSIQTGHLFSFSGVQR